LRKERESWAIERAALIAANLTERQRIEELKAEFRATPDE
jgi:hypothetical protein